MVLSIHESEREFDLSLAWANQPGGASLRLVDGRQLSVLFRGTWTHGFGPDFRDGMLSLDDGTLLTGGIEIHARTSGWRSHGHHLDARYDAVVLHVVAHDDGAETRRRDGALVPVLELPSAWLPNPTPAVEWSIVGGEICASALTLAAPEVVRELLWRLGDIRLATRVARFEAQLTDQPPAQVLYEAIWDGLGYAMNREPMRELAARLPLSMLEQLLASAAPTDRLAVALGALLGVCGFLPLSPTDAHLGGIGAKLASASERAWGQQDGWHDLALPPSAWTRARVRPLNHPVARLVAGAALLANSTDGLAVQLLTALRQRTNPATVLRDLSAVDGAPRLGTDRVDAIIASALIPFAMALGEQTGDDELRDGASAAWEALPTSAGNEVTRRARRQVAGDLRLLPAGGRGEQGLIHLDQSLCTPRRCFECPIASAVLAYERQQVEPA